MMISYNLFITGIIKNNLKEKLDYENVRSIVLRLSYQNIYSINKYIFMLIEELFSNQIKNFMMFLFGEYNHHQRKENNEGNELIQLVYFFLY